jgi:hypothetical protein
LLRSKQGLEGGSALGEAAGAQEERRMFAMDFWADLWSFLTGVGTLALAAATFGIIRQGRDQRADAERQHRDRLKPICVLTPFDGVDALTGRGALIETAPPRPESPSFGTLTIRCDLRNVGTGPALTLRLSIRFQDMGGWTTDPWELSPLSAGETRGGGGSPLIVPIRIGEHFNQTDFAMVPGKPWEVLLDYQDVFGNSFQSVHRKTLFDPDPSTFTWENTGPDARPKATLRAIPWFSYYENRKS